MNLFFPPSWAPFGVVCARGWHARSLLFLCTVKPLSLRNTVSKSTHTSPVWFLGVPCTLSGLYNVVSISLSFSSHLASSVAKRSPIYCGPRARTSTFQWLGSENWEFVLVISTLLTKRIQKQSFSSVGVTWLLSLSWQVKAGHVTVHSRRHSVPFRKHFQVYFFYSGLNLTTVPH